MKIKQTYVFLILLITSCNAYPQKTGEFLSAFYTFDKDEELADWLVEGERKSLYSYESKIWK